MTDCNCRLCFFFFWGRDKPPASSTAWKERRDRNRVGLQMDIRMMCQSIASFLASIVWLIERYTNTQIQKQTFTCVAKIVCVSFCVRSSEATGQLKCGEEQQPQADTTGGNYRDSECLEGRRKKKFNRWIRLMTPTGVNLIQSAISV